MKTVIRKEQGGVPTGGLTGQDLVKLSGADYDYDWGAGGSGGGGGGAELLFSFTDTTLTLPPTTTPVVVASYTIPANTFAVGDIIQISIGSELIINGSNSGSNHLDLNGGTIYSESNSADGVPVDRDTVIIGLVKASTIEIMYSSTLNRSGVSAISTVGPVTGSSFDPTVSNTLEFVVENLTNLGGLSGSFGLISVEKISAIIASSSLHSVNADENVSTWFTTNISAPVISSGNPSGWQNLVFANASLVCADYSNLAQTSHGGQLSSQIGTNVVYTNGKQLKLKFYAEIGVAGNSNNDYQLTFGSSVLKWRGSWGGGANLWLFNNTDITATFAPIALSRNLFEIVWDGTNSILYINGSIVATVATGYPSTDFGIDILLAGNPLGGGGASMKISQITVSREV